MSIQDSMEAMAEKLSVDQLRQSMMNGTLDAYVAIPLIEQKMAQEKRMRAATAMQQPQQKAMPIASRVLAEAQQMQGVDSLPTRLNFAGGGIVAFDKGGSTSNYMDEVRRYKEMASAFMPEALQGLSLPDVYQQGVEARKMYGIDEDLYKRQQADIEKEKERIAKRRSESAANRWIEAGLGILGGTSPHAAVNLKEALPAIRGYTQDIKDLEALDSALRKETQLLARDQDKALRTQAAGDIARVEQRRDAIYQGQVKQGELAANIRDKEQQRETTLEAARIGISKPTEIDQIAGLSRRARAGDKDAIAALEDISKYRAAGNPYAGQTMQLRVQQERGDVMNQRNKFMTDNKSDFALVNRYTPDSDAYKQLSPDRKRSIDQTRERLRSGLATFDAQLARLDSMLGSQPSASTPQAAPAATAKPAPKVGEVVQGYKYIGGDPSKESSWQKV